MTDELQPWQKCRVHECHTARQELTRQGQGRGRARTHRRRVLTAESTRKQLTGTTRTPHLLNVF